MEEKTEEKTKEEKKGMKVIKTYETTRIMVKVGIF